MKAPFKTSFVDSDEFVMVVGEINPDEIRLNYKTKEIFLVYEEKKKPVKKGKVKNETKRKAH